MALASSVRFPNAQGYAGVRARGLGPEAVVQRPNELVELAEVPGAEARIVKEVGGSWRELLPVDVTKNVRVIHSALYNLPK